MKSIIVTIALILIHELSMGQSEVAGIYTRLTDETSRKIKVKPDSTFYSSSQISCGYGPIHSDTGIWKVQKDTLLLIFSTGKKEHYLISNLSEQVKPLFDGDKFLPTLSLTMLQDTGQVTDEIYTLNGFYYPNGQIKYFRIDLESIIIETLYYSNGQVIVTKQYKKGKKNGDWCYYNENGFVRSIEKYKNGKLKIRY